ncbi:MAG: hypothetical protein O2894_11070 [Planctomycetota bacterium]|nr:hypothetical protein [Planctomycetota bacterium]
MRARAKFTRLALLALPLLMLAGCADEPTPVPVTEQVWHLAPQELVRLFLEHDEGALAWVPADALAKVDLADEMQLLRFTELLSKTVVARLVLRSDNTFVLDLRAEDEDAAWRTVKATGAFEETNNLIRLRVRERSSKNLAPLEVADEVLVRRHPTWLALEALNRTIPLSQRDL